MNEIINFHKKFVKTFNEASAKIDIDRFELTKSLNKPVLSFSSGMKQRLKLILALNNDVPVIFLDEPCSNLDENGISIYKDIVTKKHNNKLIIVATNQAGSEFPMTGETIDLEKFN